MMARLFLRLKGDVRGATAVEFALLGPAFIMFILLVIEGSRMIWTQQALQEVAYSAARCYALGLGTCSSDATTQSFGNSRLSDWGIKATPTSYNFTATCQSMGSNSIAGKNVSITLPFSVASGFFPGVPNSITASACYPTIN